MSNEQVTLKLSKIEYERLLKLVYLGGWMVNSHRVEDIKTEYDKLEGKVYSYAGSAGLGKYADFDEEKGSWFPSGEMDEDEEVRAFIDEYDDHTFWEDLSWNFADRDYARQVPAPANEEHFIRVCRLKDAYDDEFEAYGLENLFVAKGFFLKGLVGAVSAISRAASRALKYTRRPKQNPDKTGLH